MADEESRRVVKLTGDHIDVDATTNWRNKTGGYFQTEVSILHIVGKDGGEVTPIWEKEWHESAPAIETRTRDDNVRQGRFETAWNKTVRIHRDACPVEIQFRELEEYIDWDDREFNSHVERMYWVRYET
jgi:hypothetical protein